MNILTEPLPPDEFMTADRWEFGSDFHYTQVPPGDLVPWPSASVWYSSGRHLLVALIAHLGGSRKVWIPSYFCGDVSSYWSTRIDLREYIDDPLRAEPDWDSLNPSPGDVVLSVNYFGVRNVQPFYDRPDRGKFLLVEDHTHDPLGRQARESRADYVFSSLRKTLPVPDGAILWSPAGHSLPRAPRAHEHPGAALRAAAMIMKRDYLTGVAQNDTKERYRALFREGEHELENGGNYSVCELTRAVAARGIPRSWQLQRESNVSLLRRAFPGIARCLTESWPVSSIPFAAVFLFDSSRQRDIQRQIFEAERIYCPVHWPDASRSSRDENSLSSRILTVPSDHRYRQHDVLRVLEVAQRGKN